jgi:YVTN family beta-propeller protein
MAERGGTVFSRRAAHPLLGTGARAVGLRLLHLAIAAGLLFSCLGILPVEMAAAQAVAPRYASSAIALTPGGAILLAVNPDSNSLTLVDTASRQVLVEIPVGVDPRSVAVTPDGGRAFVANQGSDSLTVVDLAGRAVVATLPVGSRPVGVAVSPEGRFVAVAERGSDRVRLLDAVAYATLALVPVADRPYGLAFTPDGRRLLVTHLLTGEVSLLSVQAFHSFLALVANSSGGTLSTPPPSQSQNESRSASLLLLATLPTWPNIAPAPAIIINSTASRAYLPQTMANGQGYNTAFDTTVFPKVSVLNLETGAHQSSEHIPLPEVDRPVGLPWDAALARGDSELWVANSASNDLSVINISSPTRPVRTANIPVGSHPAGVVVSPDGETAYANNTLDGTVSIIDAHTYTVTATIPVTTLPLPPALLNGKRLFFSSAQPNLAQARWISCNTCHIEGEGDGRTWLVQYTGPVPPGEEAVVRRNTTGLYGMSATYPLRWSAEWDESADSEFSIRFEQFGAGLIEGLMNPTLGPPNQGRSYDLDCLAAYLDSLELPARSHTLTPAEQRGRAIFESPQTACLTCHPPPLYTDLKTHDVGTASGPGEWFGPAIDTPVLNLLFDSAPYLHDGRAATLLDVLTTRNPADQHGVTSHLSASQLADLVLFLLALPY